MNGKIKPAWLIGKNTDDDGFVYLGSSDNYQYIISAGIGESEVNNLYVSKVFKNKYGLWYAQIKNGNDELATNIKQINILILYSTE